MGIASNIIKKATKKGMTKKQLKSKTAAVFGAVDKMKNIPGNKPGMMGYEEYLTGKNKGLEYLPNRYFENGLAGEETIGRGFWRDPTTNEYYAIIDGKLYPAMPENPRLSPINYGGQFIVPATQYDQSKVLKDALQSEKLLKNVTNANEVMGNAGSMRRSVNLNDPVALRMTNIEREIKELSDIAADHAKAGNIKEAKEFAKKAMEAQKFQYEHMFDALDNSAPKIYKEEEFYGPFINDIFGNN